MRFLERAEPHWHSGRVYEKVATLFASESERIAPDSVLRPIYPARYGWGAMIVGPGSDELESRCDWSAADHRVAARGQDANNAIPGEQRNAWITCPARLARARIDERSRRARHQL